MSVQEPRILVVDDEREIRALLKSALEMAGYNCKAAPDADAALRMLSEEPFDLMFIDVMMPHRSGVELFHDVHSSHPDIAVVFVTAKAEVELAVDTLRSGAYDFLVKPVSIAQLEQTAERVLLERRKVLERTAYLKNLEENIARQEQVLEGYQRQLQGLNRMMQSKLEGQFEVRDLAHEVAQAARSTAQLLIKLADQTTAHLQTMAPEPSAKSETEVGAK